MAKGINYGQLMHKAMRRFHGGCAVAGRARGTAGQASFLHHLRHPHPGVDMAGSLAQRYPRK